MPETEGSTPDGPVDASALQGTGRPSAREQGIETAREALADLAMSIPGSLPENRAEQPDDPARAPRETPPTRSEGRARFRNLAANVRGAAKERYTGARTRLANLRGNLGSRFRST